MQGDEVMSEAKVQGCQVIYEEMKVRRETDGTREQTAISSREHPGDPQCPCLILDSGSDDLGDQLFVSKKGKLSESKVFSKTTRGSRTMDELDGDTTV